MVGCGPNEGDGKERDRLWNDMDRILDRIGNGYRLCIQGDLNGWIGYRTRAAITGAFRVPEDDNGRRVVEFCAERGLCVGNAYFNHKSLQNYTRVAREQDSVLGREHDRSGARDEGYAALSAGCVSSERNGTRSLRSPCGTV